MVTTSSSVTVSNRSRTSGWVSSSTSSTLARSSLSTKEVSPAGGVEGDTPAGGVPAPGSMCRTPRTARSSSVAERSSLVTAPMRHRAPTSAGGSPSGTSRRYFTRARGRYSRPPEKKRTHQTTRAAPVAAPETAQAMTSLRCSARTSERARSRASFAAAASCASVARRLGRMSMSVSWRVLERLRREEQVGLDEGRRRQVVHREDDRSVRAPPDHPVQRAVPPRPDLAGVRAVGQDDDRAHVLHGHVPAPADQLPRELARVGEALGRRPRPASGRRTAPTCRSEGRRPRCGRWDRPSVVQSVVTR